VKANFDPLIIGKGDYVVSIGIFDGLTEADTVGTKVLEVQDRTYRLRIVAPPEIAMDRGLVVHPVRWQFSK
jgi:lipopolysaccharide transport system ATP-binding protein